VRQQNPKNESDSVAHLWTDLKNGDDKAFERIYSLYVDDLYRFGKSISDRHALIKDCIQDVFIDLWHYRAKLTDNVHIKFYLFRVLSNKIQRQIGNERKCKDTEYREFFDKNIFQPSFEDDWIDRQELSVSNNKLEKALSRLPVRQREVIHYVFFEKLTYEQVAIIMEITIRSAYTLTWKAIQTLKKSFVSFALFVCFLIIN
jgi:RNA polymerase sigma factor (sigma-70 family)